MRRHRSVNRVDQVLAEGLLERQRQQQRQRQGQSKGGDAYMYSSLPQLLAQLPPGSYNHSKALEADAISTSTSTSTSTTAGAKAKANMKDELVAMLRDWFDIRDIYRLRTACAHVVVWDALKAYLPLTPKGFVELEQLAFKS